MTSRPDSDVYRPLSCEDWDCLRGVSPLALRAFFELFWGSDSERAGVVAYRPAAVADELGSSRRAIVVAVAELVEAGLVEADESARVAYRVGHIERFAPRDRSRLLAWRRSVPPLRGSTVAAAAIATIEASLAAATVAEAPPPSKASSKPAPKRSPAPAAAPQGARFVAPTAEDVAKAFRERGMPPLDVSRESAKFVAYYGANGWKVGKNAMKSWRAAATGWHVRWAESHPTRAGRTTDLDDWRRGIDAAQGGDR